MPLISFLVCATDALTATESKGVSSYKFKERNSPHEW